MRLNLQVFFGVTLLVAVCAAAFAAPSALAADGAYDALLRSESGVRGESAYTSYPGLGMVFTYPAQVRLADPEQGEVDPTAYALSIVVEPLSGLEPGEDVVPEESRDAALREQAALAQGRPGEETADEYAEGTIKVVRLPNGRAAKTYAVFGRYEVCDVTFERIAVFYWKDCRVTLRLYGPKQNIKADNKELFTRDAENCGEESIWDFNADAQKRFLQKLRSGQAGPHAAAWEKLFPEILQGIRFDARAGSAASSPDVCRDAAEKLLRHSSGMRPLPGKSLAVRIPHVGDACLLVATPGQDKGEMLFLVPQNAGHLENLALAPRCRGRVAGLQAVDLNQDGFPEFLARVDCASKSGSVSGSVSGNRVFWSIPYDLGVEWQVDAAMSRRVKDAQSTDAMEGALRAYLAELNKDAGKTIQLTGRFASREQQLIFRADAQPKDVLYEIRAVPKAFAGQCRGLYDRSGDISARVQRVERLHGLSHIYLELLECR